MFFNVFLCVFLLRNVYKNNACRLYLYLFLVAFLIKSLRKEAGSYRLKSMAIFSDQLVHHCRDALWLLG